MNAFLRGLAGSASVAAGYLPIAFGFGLTALQAGLSPQSTLLISMAGSLRARSVCLSGVFSILLRTQFAATPSK